MDPNFYYAIFVGFFAQLVDGTLGMAYGISSSTFLLSLGFPPKLASALTHAAELILTGISGISHSKFGNVDKKIFRQLVIPGMLGGIAGAYFLVSLPAEYLKPFVTLYLLLMGVIILRKAFKKKEEAPKKSGFAFLGLIGGFFDAIGGGGWGPIVTSTLVARGLTPRMAIGSVNLAEFFVTVSESAVFLISLNLIGNWQIILGLLLGGAATAPFAAFLCKKLPNKILMILVGLLISGLSLRNFFLLF